ncbi:MAG: ABC transporter permease [Firmicutes bacterium]|nr:ABC transporter permease [Candidatus Fermentithermobacillaceae bacterium]
MARSSNASRSEQVTVGAMEIKEAEANLFSLYSLIAKRRIRYTPVFAVLILCSVIVSVAASFLVTTVIARNVETLSARVEEAVLPFDGLLIFASQEELDTFMKREKYFKDKATLTVTNYVEVESTIGPLRLIGNGLNLQNDTIELLFPWTPSQPLDTQVWEIKAWVMGRSGPETEFKWSDLECRCEDESTPHMLYGWASVNPSVIENIKGSKPCVVLNTTQLYSTNPLRERLFRDLEKTSYGAARVITPLAGKVSLERATQGAFSYWHVISLIVLLGTAVAITCVLTVSFLGRKRPLGIIRVLGGTISDLARMMLVEAAYMGTPGIVLGVFAGKYLTGFLEQGSVLPWSAYVVSIVTGVLTLLAGVYLPIKLIKNANCDQLLNNKPVYVVSNPSCANCGLCGGV